MRGMMHADRMSKKEGPKRESVRPKANPVGSVGSASSHLIPEGEIKAK